MIGPTIEETLAFIIQAHGEQTRRGGETPYYTHPVAVAKIADAICESLRIPDNIRYDVNRAALLHDIDEDTPVSIMMLGKMGYPIGLLNSVYLLTKEEGETHNQNVDRIIASEDIVALVGKVGDTYHNSIMSEKDVEWCIANEINPSRQHARYMKSFNRLIEKLVEMTRRNGWLTDVASTKPNDLSTIIDELDPYVKGLMMTMGVDLSE